MLGFMLHRSKFQSLRNLSGWGRNLLLGVMVFQGCAGNSFPFTKQGEILFDGIGNIKAHLTDAGIADDDQYSSKSVFLLLVYKVGAILDKQTALDQTGLWGCIHGRVPAADTEDGDNATADGGGDNDDSTVEENTDDPPTTKDNCIEGIGFSNDPGFAKEDRDVYTNRQLHPVIPLDLSLTQWVLEVYGTNSQEMPSRYQHDYNLFQSLTTPRHEDEEFDAYLAAYYDRADSFLRNPIAPDHISPAVRLKAKFTPDGPTDVAGNIYDIPPYKSWKKNLKELY